MRVTHFTTFCLKPQELNVIQCIEQEENYLTCGSSEDKNHIIIHTVCLLT